MAQQTRINFTTGLGVEIADINTKINSNLPDNVLGLITPANHRLVNHDEKDSINTLFTNLKDSAFLPLTDNTDVIGLEGATNLWYTDTRARMAISETITGIDYNNVTGVFSLTAGYMLPTTTQAINWQTAYDNLNRFTTDALTPSTTRRYLPTQLATISPPVGGAVVDVEARTAITVLIARLQASQITF